MLGGGDVKSGAAGYVAMERIIGTVACKHSDCFWLPRRVAARKQHNHRSNRETATY